ncbi:MAG: FHA domain-containing protein [Planctomycetes bacterium]|nr:FHA domain-containing protein [Planctomycetota bacterium]
MARREVRIDPGAKLELTSLRTRRKVECRIDAVLGVGGTALVCAGTLADGTHVVLKVPRFEGEHDAGFEVECELFKHFAHRNIVHCVGVGVLQGSLAIGFRRAYENPLLLMTRASVDEAMRRDKKARYPSLPLDTSIDLGYELLNGLEYVERLGYVHHDVKLANLLIDVAGRDRPLEPNEVFGKVVRREYRGVLIDFGATRSREYLEAYNEGRAPPGLAPQVTPFYAPPEAIVEARRPDGSLGLTFDPSQDVYAVALMLYAMVTGHPPYSHLRTPVEPTDLETLISVKSAERRGEIEPVSLEVIQRVVFEDTRFVTGDRAAWDLAFHRFLLARMAPDPQRRGTVGQMKRDFEQLMCVKSARGDAQDMGERGASRVFLPFTQELVKVGSGGEHPLLRAARACGVSLDVAAASSGVFQLTRGGAPAAARTPPPAASTPPPSTDSGLDWLDEAPDARRVVRPASRPPGPARTSTRRHDREGLTRAAPTAERTPPPARPESRPPGPAARPPRAPRLRPEFDETQWGHQTEKRQVHGGAGDQDDPCRRPLPARAKAEAPHVLVSALLDEPLLLSREKKVLLGRDISADVRIKSDLVSRRHAEIGWTGKGFAVVDLGSVNGTLVNGARIGGACHLHADDRISLSGFELVVKLLTGGDVEDGAGGGGTTRVMRPELARQLRKESLTGELGQLQLKDVLELLEWKKHTGVLTITPSGAPPGKLFLSKGQLHHAETPRGHKGVEAAVVLLRVTAGRFVFEPGPVKAPKTVTIDNEAVWEKVRGG